MDSRIYFILFRRGAWIPKGFPRAAAETNGFLHRTLPGRIVEAKNKGLTWEGYYDEYDKGKVGTFSSEEL